MHYQVFYIAECGGELTGTSGTLSSPGLTERGGYNHSLNCLWTYHNPSPNNGSLLINVNYLDLESYCYDSIRIYVGGYQSTSNSYFVAVS